MVNPFAKSFHETLADGVPVMRNRSLIWLLAIFALVPGYRVGAAELLAGTSVVDITPDTEKYHVPLGGYGARMNAAAHGVHDSTLAKTIIFKQGDKKYALVTTDLLGIPRSLRDEVLARIADAGITSDNFMICASHTHASLEMAAMNRNNVFGNKAIGVFDESLLQFTAERIAEGVLNADSAYEPVQAGSGVAHVEGLNRNRRGDDITDEDMTILRLDRPDGTPRVALINYTAHPTFMNPKVLHISAGWPGYLQRNVEAFVGHDVICMYINGAQGDVGPSGATGPSPYARAEDYGRKLAIHALDLFASIKTQADAPFAYSMDTLTLPTRVAPPALIQSAGPEYGLDEKNINMVVNAMAPETSYLGVLRVGEFTAISIPGEMASVLGLQVKDAVRKNGAAHPIIAGLGNEWISYILPPEEYHQGGYEPGVSFYGDQLGPVIVEQAIAAGSAVQN